MRVKPRPGNQAGVAGGVQECGRVRLSLHRDGARPPWLLACSAAGPCRRPSGPAAAIFSGSPLGCGTRTAVLAKRRFRPRRRSACKGDGRLRASGGSCIGGALLYAGTARFRRLPLGLRFGRWPSSLRQPFRGLAQPALCVRRLVPETVRPSCTQRCSLHCLEPAPLLDFAPPLAPGRPGKRPASAVICGVRAGRAPSPVRSPPFPERRFAKERPMAVCGVFLPVPCVMEAGLKRPVPQVRRGARRAGRGGPEAPGRIPAFPARASRHGARPAGPGWRARGPRLRLRPASAAWRAAPGAASARAASSASGAILPSGPSSRVSLAPAEKNSGAPHSSSSIWAVRAQNTVSQGCAIAARISAFAAVPVPARNTSASGASKAPRSADTARAVTSSAP